jgi:hypothetical protein
MKKNLKTKPSSRRITSGRCVPQTGACHKQSKSKLFTWKKN